MTHLALLKKLEEFFDKDLKGERLSFKCSTKKVDLLEQIRAAINLEQRNNGVTDNQRQRTISHDRANLPLPQVPSQNTIPKKVENEMPTEQEDFYMDLNETQAIPNNSLNSQLLVPNSIGDGSGSGYESYASEDETNNRTKKAKDNESLEQYFSGTNYDVFSVVYVENKTFLSGKKWQKRIGVVKECHFQCFKKLGDPHPVLDLPLRAYTAHLSTKEGTTSIIVSLEATGSSDGDGYRFSIDHGKMSEWVYILREKAAGFTESEGLPAPPVAQRPVSSLPEHSPVKRTGSKSDLTEMVVRDRRISEGTALSPTSISNSTSSTNPFNIGKGLKSAVTDMFKKKDHMKKKISVAEQLGADLCSSLGVYHEGKWVKRLCAIQDNTLYVYGKDDTPEQSIVLHGCDLKPNFDDPIKKCVFKITKNNNDVIFLEASNSAEMGKWVGMLIAETGCAEMPESKPEDENIYVEPDFYESVMDTARKFFHDTKTKKGRTKPTSPPPAIPEEGDGVYLDVVATAPPPLVSAPPAVKQPGKGAFAEPANNSALKQKKLNEANRPRTYSFEQSKGESSASHNLHFQSKSKEERNKPIKKKKNKPEQTKEHIISLNVVRSDQDQITQQNSSNTSLQTREKSLEERKQEITQQIKVLRVKKTELSRYVEAAKQPKEKLNIIRPLEEVKQNFNKLENELVNVERELRNVKRVRNHSIDEPSNLRPQTRPKETPPQTGNVASRTKLFENLENNK